MTRRSFLALAATFAGATSAAAASRDPHYGGVELGVQSFSFKEMPFEKMLESCEQAGVYSIELWSGHLEPRREQLQGAGGRGGLREWRVREGVAACEKALEAIQKRGLRLNAFNLSLRNDASDDEMDAAMRMTRALGLDLLTSSSQVSTAPRIDVHAKAHRVRVGFHNHARIKEDEFATPQDFQKAMDGGSGLLGVNLDVGHFHAAGFDNLAYLRENHARVFALHIKDREGNDGAKVPFGKGHTQLNEILRLVRDGGWKMPANIEMAYPTDDPVREVRESLEYMKRALDA